MCLFVLELVFQNHRIIILFYSIFWGKCKVNEQQKAHQQNGFRQKISFYIEKVFVFSYKQPTIFKEVCKALRLIWMWDDTKCILLRQRWKNKGWWINVSLKSLYHVNVKEVKVRFFFQKLLDDEIKGWDLWDDFNNDKKSFLFSYKLIEIMRCLFSVFCHLNFMLQFFFSTW